MSLPQFDDLPFNARPDLSPYLIHLTKNTKKDDQYSAFENLVNILKTGEIWGSSTSKGFIKGKKTAACFMDVPFQALKYVLTPENTDPQHPRYEPYGVVVKKKDAYDRGCRPVLYLSDQETSRLQIQHDELWRVARLEVTNKGGICWLHEREWRCRGSFALPEVLPAVLVKSPIDVKKLTHLMESNRDAFACIPRSIIPLAIVCQGLLKR